MTPSNYSLYLKNDQLSLKLSNPPPRTLPLDRFDVPHFVPPTVAETVIVSEGTSYNRYGGEKKIGIRAENIEFSFPIFVFGTTEQQIRRNLSDLQSVLDLAGNDYDPLYLCFKPHTYLSGEPLWGQMGAFIRYEIVSGKVYVESYDFTREQLVKATVQLTLKPYSLGQKQRLANGYGGLMQNHHGYADGQSRGAIVFEATTNKFVNATFIGRYGFYQDDAWVVGAGLKVSEIIDGRFRLFQSESKRLYGTPGAVDRTFTQSIACGNTNKWSLTFFVKKEDGSAVTTADVDLYFGADIATTYELHTNGWYKLTATFDGVVAATSVGIDVKAGKTIYVHGAQFEEKKYPTNICVGDMVGCSYSGIDLSVATSSRLASKIVIPCEDASNYNRVIDPARGTIALVYTPRMSSTQACLVAASFLLLVDTTGRMVEIHFNTATSKWSTFSAPNAYTEAAASTFPANVPIVFHLKWGPSGIYLYKNASLIVSGGTYTPQAMPANLFIGCYNNGSLQANGVIGDFSTYGWEFSAAEISAQYADILSRLSEGRIESPIPYISTRLGDGVIDSHSDSGHSHVAVADGIAGNVPADTKFDLSHNVGALDILISNLACKEYIPPAILGSYSAANSNAVFFMDVGEAADTADAAAAGAFYKALDCTAEATPNGYGRLCALPNRLNLGDRDYLAYVRLKASSAAGMVATLRCKYSPDTSFGDASIYQLGEPKDWSTFVGDATYTCIYSNPVHMPRFRRTDAKLSGIGFERIFWWLTLITVPASTQRIDYVGLLPRPIKRIVLGTTADLRFVIRGNQVNPGASGEASVNGYGDDISLEPNLRNIIQVVHAAYTDADADSLAYNLTINNIEYVPKWRLL